MFWWKWRCRDKQQRLELELKNCRGKLSKGLRLRLCRLETLELAQLLLRVWPRLGEAAREQVTVLVEEKGFIEEWLGLLKKDKNSEKILTATVLGELAAGQALAPLLWALGDTDEGVQMAAAAALARIGDPRSLEPLLVALTEPLRWPPARVAEVLVALGPVSVPPLLELLPKGPVDLTVRVIAILAMFKDDRVVPSLEICLQTGPVDVREAAAAALGEIGAVQAIPGLKKAVADPAARVRTAAIRGLGRLKCSDARELLQNCLTDGAWEVRAATVAALQEMAVGNS